MLGYVCVRDVIVSQCVATFIMIGRVVGLCQIMVVPWHILIRLAVDSMARVCRIIITIILAVVES